MPNSPDSVRIKICGVSTASMLEDAIEAGADYIGCVHFPPSVRHVDINTAGELCATAKGRVKTVIVTVDPTDALIHDIVEKVRPDFLQLHGKESVERCRAIRQHYPGLKLIKALKIAESDDVAAARAYQDVVDMLLFDAAPPSHLPPGGNGLTFDWELLSHRDFAIDWFLSGGLSADNVQEALRLTGARFVDVSSSVESEPGQKDKALMNAFITSARG